MYIHDDNVRKILSVNCVFCFMGMTFGIFGWVYSFVLFDEPGSEIAILG